MLTFYQFAKFICRYLLPEKLRYPVARLVARWTCRLNRPRRSIIVDNLTPLVGAEEAKRLAPELLGNFLMTAVDFFCAPKNLSPSLVFENEAFLPEVYKQTQRVMMVTAHMGYWELGMSYLVQKGYAVSGVYAPYREDAVVEWIMSHRNAEVEWIPTTPGAAEACIQALKRGRVLGMVGDVPFGEEGRLVAIAGHTARLPIGPWVIAARAQAAVIPSFILRQAPGQYRGIFHTPIQPLKGSLRQQIESTQNQFRNHLEFYLQKYPTQWGVLQPFWG